MDLLRYPFLLPLVIAFLNDGDVVARLLITSKSIRQMITKYTFKRLCVDDQPIEIVQASRDIQFSFEAVTLEYILSDSFPRAQKLNKSPLKYCKYGYSGYDKMPNYGVTHLQINRWSHRLFRVPVGLIPRTVIDLEAYSCQLEVDSIPASVKTVRLMDVDISTFDPSVIPSTVTSLSITDSKQNPQATIHSVFPASLTSLQLDHHNQPFAVGILPSSLKSITCNSELLSKLDPGAIPDSVVSLELKWDDLYVPKSGVAPNTVSSIVVKTDVHKSIIDLGVFSSWAMPASLKDLTLHVSFDKKIGAGLIPATLTHFNMTGSQFGGLEVGALPNSITHLSIKTRELGIPRGTIPHSVTHLSLDQDSKLASHLEPGDIPSSVTHLLFSCNNQQKMTAGIIPNSVTHLTFGSDFNRPLSEGAIPSFVTHLIFEGKFNQLLKQKPFPSTLTHLYLCESFQRAIGSSSESFLPTSLTHLQFEDDYNCKIHPGRIPDSVTHLALGSEGMFDLNEDQFPRSLTYLQIPRGHVKADDKLWLPPGVTHVSYKRELLPGID